MPKLPPSLACPKRDSYGGTGKCQISNQKELIVIINFFRAFVIKSVLVVLDFGIWHSDHSIITLACTGNVVLETYIE
jgi:hypothetical protein